MREVYSSDGDSWRYFTHDQARSRAYRWGEDGLLGSATAKAAWRDLLLFHEYFHADTGRGLGASRQTG